MDGDVDSDHPDSGDRDIGPLPAGSGGGSEWLAPPRRGTYVRCLMLADTSCLCL